jgi:signal transduction histidine kinase
MNSFPQSFRARITLLTLSIFVIGIWAVAISASQVLRNDMERQLGAQQFATTSLIANEINQQLADRLHAIETVAAHMGVATKGDVAAMQDYLDQRLVLQTLFNGGLFVTDTRGTAIADVPQIAGRIGTNYMDRTTVSIPLTEGRSLIGKPALGKKLQKPIFSIAAPVRDKQGRVIGALLGNINLGLPSFLDQIGEDSYGKTGGYLLIAPQHNLFVTATDKSRSLQPLPAPGVNPMHDRYMQGYEGHGVAVSSRGVAELSAAKRIPVAGWFLVTALPVAEAFAPIDSMLQHMFLVAIVLTLLAGGLVWWLTTLFLHRQIAPILSSTDAIRALTTEATGRLTPPMPADAPDEIGELINGFNRLLHILTQREADLKAAYGELRRLSDHLQDAREAERKALALDIHDQLGASLTGIRMRLEALIADIPDDEAGQVHAAELQMIADLARTSQQSVRELCTRLRPSVLDDLGLVEACRWLLRDWAKTTGLATCDDFAPLAAQPDDALATDIFRCLQELLTNVARHAGATQVAVALSEQAQVYRLRVSDDGHGFDGADKTGGFGLAGLRERASRHGGEVLIESATSGTVVTITFVGGGVETEWRRN